MNVRIIQRNTKVESIKYFPCYATAKQYLRDNIKTIKIMLDPMNRKI